MESDEIEKGLREQHKESLRAGDVGKTMHNRKPNSTPIETLGQRRSRRSWRERLRNLTKNWTPRKFETPKP